MVQNFRLFGLVLLLSVGATTVGNAASFDCNKATTETEIAICADPYLSALDELIAYWNMWSEDDRADVRKDALDQIDIITALGQKIDCYRSYALRLKEEEE